MWYNHTNGVCDVIVNIALILSKEAIDDALGLYIVASPTSSDNILAISISISKTSFV
jgi:hypothetical protein